MPRILAVTSSRRALRGALFVACLTLGVHCGGGETSSSVTTSSSSTSSTTDLPCAVNEQKLPDGRCQPPGLPLDMPCPPGEAPLPDGACQSAGVPPSQCGEGFEANGKGGCRPILPPKFCPDGLMAIPGETACHEVAPCGDGTWGDIPVEASTQFVDSSYAAGGSDGTQAKPWKTIQEGIDAATDGAIVAVAQGSYAENVEIAAGNPVRLWGRCPGMVTIVGSGPSSAAVAILAENTEVRGLAITTEGIGLASAAEGVIVEHVHIHDTLSVGLLSDNAEVTVRGSLFERTHRSSVLAQATGVVTIEQSHLKDNRALPNGTFGHGVEVLSGAKPSTVTVRRTLIERSNDAAISGDRSVIGLEQTAIRETLPVPGQPLSAGVGLGLERCTLTLVESTIEHVHAAGIELVGCVATVDRATVIDTQPLSMTTVAYYGIRVISHSASGTPSDLTLRSSTIARSPHAGLMVFKSKALVESTLVRDNMVDLIYPKGAPVMIDTSSAVFRYSALVGNQAGGLLVRRGDATFDASVVKDVKLDLGFGACVAAVRLPGEGPATAMITSSLLQDCSQIGAFAYHGNVTVQSSIVRDVLPDEVGDGGDAISVVNQDMPDGTLTVSGTLIDEPTRAGVSSFGGAVTVDLSAIVCAKYAVVGEPMGMFSPSVQEPATSLCGCPEASEGCNVESPGLPPPADL